MYDALAAGVLVSLGTDWTASGSRSLLHELKVADVALRDDRLLGDERTKVGAYSIAGKSGAGRRAAEDALDQAIVDMITRNPALALRWYDKVGSIEPGKIADLTLVRRPSAPQPAGTSRTPYRDLIDATDQDVQLVLVGGEPRAGRIDWMSTLKPATYERVTSTSGHFVKAVDVIGTTSVPDSNETLAEITFKLDLALSSLGGDHPPVGGGPGPVTNTDSYLKANVSGGAAAGLADAVFESILAGNVGQLSDGSLNLEAVTRSPLLEDDDHFLAAILNARVNPVTGLLFDLQPPYRQYPANFNWINGMGNPLAGLPG